MPLELGTPLLCSDDELVAESVRQGPPDLPIGRAFVAVCWSIGNEG
jgi:hypothetical protein